MPWEQLKIYNMFVVSPNLQQECSSALDFELFDLFRIVLLYMAQFLLTVMICFKKRAELISSPSTSVG